VLQRPPPPTSVLFLASQIERILPFSRFSSAFFTTTGTGSKSSSVSCPVDVTNNTKRSNRLDLDCWRCERIDRWQDQFSSTTGTVPDGSGSRLVIRLAIVGTDVELECTRRYNSESKRWHRVQVGAKRRGLFVAHGYLSGPARPPVAYSRVNARSQPSASVTQLKVFVHILARNKNNNA
jgi:hypothetical protein